MTPRKLRERGEIGRHRRCVAFAVADDLGVPIKFIGTGEKVENLAPFDPESFVAALFAQD